MSRRSKKKPENFCWDTCESYPRCSGCEHFDVCVVCDTPLCWWVAGVLVDDETWCRMCYEVHKATGTPI